MNFRLYPHGRKGFISRFSSIFLGLVALGFSAAVALWAQSSVDTDGDGIPDIADADADNDGVLNVTEAPACFFTPAEWNTTNKSDVVTVGSDLTLAGAFTNLPALTDGAGGTNGVIQFSTNQVSSNKAVLTFTFLNPIQLDAVVLSKTNATQIFGTNLILQGANNLTNWINLAPGTNVGNASVTTTNGAVVVTNGNRYPVTTNAAAYRYYRLWSTNTNAPLAGTLSEIYFDVNTNTYVTSLYPKTNCTTDTDGDGTNNYLDLDSDGDGTGDAYESGATTNLANRSATYAFPINAVNVNGVPTAVQTNVTSDAVTYTSTYNIYAISASQNLGLDSDSDGIFDPFDMDDDNDGVPDMNECPVVSNFINGSFENPGAGAGGNSFPTSMPGWQTTDTAFEVWGTGFLGVPAYEGGSFMEINAYISGSLFQDIPTTPGITLPVSFAHRGRNGVDTMRLEAGPAGGPYTTLGTYATGTTAWKKYSVNYVVPAGQTTTRFRLTAVSTSDGNISAGNLVDAFSIDTPTQCDIDSDGDGIPNRLDPDSDGDGCGDAYEAGATTDQSATFKFTGPAGTNGLPNEVETVADNGVVNYLSTYQLIALNYGRSDCIDTDGDTVPDYRDADADNDGVLNVTEAPACFFTANEWNTANKSTMVTVSSELNAQPSANYFDMLTDGIGGNNGAVQFMTNQVSSNKSVLTFTFVNPIRLDAVVLSKNSGTQIFATNLILQGANSPTNWVNLMAAGTNVANASVTMSNGGTVVTNGNRYPVTTNAAAYRYYRLWSTNTNAPLTGTLSEVYFDVNTNTYVTSLYPKATCDKDTDGDGTNNYLDLDSDGDGTGDAYESGASTNLSPTFAFTNAVNENGVPTAVQTNPTSDSVIYNSTYNRFALDSTENMRLDSDGDGVADVVDLDDDNDGIPDATETGCGPSVTFYGTDGGVKAENTAPPGWALSVSSPDIADATGHVYGPWNVGCTGTAPLPPNGHLSWMSFFSNTQEAFKTTLNNLVPGQTYRLQVHYGKFAALGVGLGQVTIKLGSTVIDQYTPTLGCGWETRTITFTPTATSQDLQFQNTGPTSATWNANISISADALTTVCLDPDYDNDGIPNRLDLDSDADGCGDAFEAGASTSNSATFAFSGPYGINGLADAVETTPESGTINYLSTYNLMAQSYGRSECVDTDGDGVPDYRDADADNDGVLNLTEAPACFFTANEWNTTNKSSLVTVSSDLMASTSLNQFVRLTDGVGGTTGAVQFATNQVSSNRAILTFAFINPIRLDALVLGKTNATQIFGSSLILQGANSPTNWVNLMAAGTNAANASVTMSNGGVAVANANRYPVTTNAAAYRYYRLWSTNTNAPLTGTLSEVYFDVNTNTYVTSLFPKTNCTTDTDGDGTNNYLDLDSDGDGGSDALESGATTNRTTNYSFPGPYNANGVPTAVQTNAASDTVTYNSTYNTYAIKAVFNLGLDSDGDGIVDPFDMDDDNDGVPDLTEGFNCDVEMPLGVADGSFESLVSVASTNAYNSNVSGGGWSNGSGTADSWLAPLPLTGSGFFGGMADGTPPSPDGRVFAAGHSPVSASGPTGANIDGEAFHTTIGGLTIGEKYTLAFYQANAGIEDNNTSPTTSPLGHKARWKVTFGSQTNYSTEMPYLGEGNQVWMEEKIEFTASATSQKLEFTVNSGSDGSQYFDCMAVDGIRLIKSDTTVACSRDTDGDGIPDHLDLDSDGDGCGDAYEAGATTNNSPTFAFGGPFGTNGLADALETTNTSLLPVVYSITTKNLALASAGSTLTSTNAGAMSGQIMLGAVETGRWFLTDFRYTRKATGTTNTLTGTMFSSAIANNPYGQAGVGMEMILGAESNGVTGFSYQVRVEMNPGYRADRIRFLGRNPASSVWYGPAVGTNGTVVSPGGSIRVTGFAGANAGVVSDPDDNLVANDGQTFSAGVDLQGYKGGEKTAAQVTWALAVPANDPVSLSVDYTGQAFSAVNEATAFAVEVLADRTESGTINYTSTYNLMALSASRSECVDTDGDGVPDYRDADADNDGVLNVMEASTCFFTANEWNTTNKSAFVTVSSDLTPSLSQFSELTDGSGGTNGVVQFRTDQTSLNKAVLTFSFLNPVRLDALVLGKTSSTQIFGTNLILQGANNLTNWINLAPGTNVANANVTMTNGGTVVTNGNRYAVTTNASAYRYYRLWSTNTNAPLTGTLSEIYFDVNTNTYVTSLYPKATCDKDTDGDGTNNYLDLDSDGDGTSDAFESGATTNRSTNYTFPGPYNSNGVPTAVQTNAASDAVSYNSTYNNFALNSAENLTLDSDGDGILTVFDLDNDNDGVPDTVERFCAGTVVSKAGVTVTLPPTISYTYNGTNRVANLVDGLDNNNYVLSSPVAVAPATSLNGPLLNITFASPKLLTYLEVGHYQNQTLFAVGSTYKVQGSHNEADWADVSGTLTYNNGTTSTSGGLSNFNSNIADLSGNNTAYRYYRLVGLSVTSGGGWATELHFKERACTDPDADNDGIKDYLDLDSDGDGCGDAYEAGATTNNSPTFAFSSPYGTNGLADAVETTSDSGLINYISTYNLMAQNYGRSECVDTDGDGVPDYRDADADNDGVLNVTEASTCFFTANEWNTSSKSSMVAISSDLSVHPIFNNFTGLTDGSGGTNGVVQFATNQVSSNKAVLTFTFLNPVRLDALVLGKTSTTQIFATNLILQGANNLTNWINLAPGTNVANANVTMTNGGTVVTNGNRYAVTTNASAYRYYRLWSTNTNTPSAGTLSEIYFDVNTNTYVTSLFPKTNCAKDTDGDGKLNYLDLDSDGDGASDAFESGATTNRTANYSFPGPVNTNGVPIDVQTNATSDTVNYNPSYAYADAANLNANTDSDGDGIPDLVDLDDDNDGVPDVAESAPCNLTQVAGAPYSAPPIISATSLPGNTYNFGSNGSESGGTGLAGTYDGNVVSGFNSTTFSAGFENKDNGVRYTLQSVMGMIDTFMLVNDHNFSAGASDGIESFKLRFYDQNNNLLGTTPNLLAGNLNTWQAFRLDQTYYNVKSFDLIINTTYDRAPVQFSEVAVTSSLNNFCVGSDLDTDGDGTPDRLDLDSDADGCGDAYEAGASTDKSPTFRFTGAMGANGLANVVEAGTETGTINYLSSYSLLALNPSRSSCVDTDGDGISDLNDLDADNDGVPNSTEAPACFFAANEFNTTNKASMVAVGSDLSTASGWGNFAALADGVRGTNGAVQFSTLQNPSNRAVLTFTFLSAVRLDAVVIGKTSTTQISGANLVLQGANSPTNWINLAPGTNVANAATVTMSNGGVIVTNGNRYPVTTNAAAYRYYRLWSTNTNAPLAGTLSEVFFDVNTNSYQASFFPRTNCATDTDGDGTVNYLDLDSDGDGCSDAYESGATNSPIRNFAFTNAVGSNGLVNMLETSVDSGVITYVSTYADATNASVKTCPPFPVPPTVNTLVTTNTTPTLTGLVTLPSGAGHTLSVTVNGVTYTTANGLVVDAVNGTWSLLLPTTPASVYSVLARVTDLAGQAAEDSTATELTIDTTPPVIPTVVSQITQDTTPTVTGTVNLGAGETLAVTINGVTYTTANGLSVVGTTWSVTLPSTADGTYAVTAVVTDPAGNTATDITAAELIIDTTAPLAPTVNSQITANLKPVITGTALVGPGDTLTVVVNGATYTVVPDANGNWSINTATAIPTSGTLGLFVDGVSYPVTATITDAAGNSATDTSTNEIKINTNVPLAPTVDSLTTNDDTPTVTGTVTLGAGETLAVTINGTTYTTANGLTVDPVAGTWSVALSATADGTYEVTAVVTNASSASTTDLTTNELKIDTTAPATPTVAPLSTNDTTPVISGTAVVGPGETLTVTVNGATYTVIPDGSGNWSIDTATAVPTSGTLGAFVDGQSYPVTATVTDAAGNTAVDTTNNELTIDTTAPVAPTVIGQTTNDTTPVISGTALVAAGETLTVTVNGATYTVVPDGSGNWSIDTGTATPTSGTLGTFTDGQSYPVTATVTDAAGNATSDSTTNELKIDTTPPARPTVVSQTTNDTTPVISGTAVVGAGETLTVTVNGATYTVVPDSNGNWSIDTGTATPTSGTLGTFTDGQSYPVTATVTDAGGNTTSDSTTNELKIDTTAPATPTVAPLSTNDTTPVISGTAVVGPGETLTVTVNGATYTVTPDGSGNWSIDTGTATPTSGTLGTFTDGQTYSVTATVTDAAGNATSDVTSSELVIDTTAPTPTISVNDVTLDNILNATEAGANVTITGTTTGTQAGDTVTLVVNGQTYTGTVDGSGNFSISVAGSDLAADSDQTIAASVSTTDTAGNTGTGIDTQAYTVDTTPPNLTITSVADDTGASATDKITKDNTLTISGTTEPGATVNIYDNGTLIGTVIAAPDGSYSFTTPVLPDGSHTLTATATDSAGNTSAPVNAGTWTVDTAVAITITVIAGDTLTLTDRSGLYDSTERAAGPVIISGTTTAEVGQTVVLTLNGKNYSATVQTGGAWSVDLDTDSQALNHGSTYAITASVQDLAGNTAISSGDVTLDVLIATPDVPTVVSQTTSSKTPTITGMAQKVIDDGINPPTYLPLENGDTLALTVNGVTVTATIGSLPAGVTYDPATMTWSLDTGTAGAFGLDDGPYEVTVVATSGTDTQTDISVGELIINSDPPTITIDPISTNDIINGAEKSQSLTLSGTTTAEVGSTVTLTGPEGISYTATVLAGLGGAPNHFSVTVPSSAVSSFTDGDKTLSASVTNSFGLTGTDTHDYSVDTTAPAAPVITLAKDSVGSITSDVLDNGVTDDTLPQLVITAEPGTTVKIYSNGQLVGTATEDPLNPGTYTLQLTAALADGAHSFVAVATDPAGNASPNSSSFDMTVDTVAPVVTISVNAVTADNVLNAAEAGGNVTITGSTTGTQTGDTVTLTINGQTFTGTVDASGNYSISVPGSDLAADSDTTIAASVSSTDTAGNTGTASANKAYTVDTVAPALAITLNSVTTDNVLNAAEAGGTVAITGTVTGAQAGDTVTLVINGQNFTGTVDASGNFSINVPGSDLVADADKTIAASVSSTDTAGNTGTASANKAYTADTVAPAPAITLNSVTPDNILNAGEAGGTVAITGSVTGAQTGDTVSLVINGQTFTGTVDVSGNFSINVPGSDLAADSDTTIAASVSSTDAAGNTGTASANQVYTVDTVAPSPTLAVDDVTADNVLNAAEAGGTVNITGTTTDCQPGDIVSLVVNGKTFTGTVDASGNFSIAVPGADLAADTSIAASVNATDAAGNTATATDTQTYSVDLTAPTPTISLNDVTADNVLNAAEAGGTVTITGTTTGTQVGDLVTVVVNGNSYTGFVDGSGNFSINVPGSDLALDTSVAASVSSTDTAGNTGTASDTQAYTVDLVAPTPTLTISDVTSDNVLNAAEAGGNVNITGTTTGTQTGDTVSLVINGNTYTGTVDGSGNFSISVPGSDLAADTTISGSVSSTDAAGNTGTGTDTQSYTVDTVAPAPVITIDPVTPDNILNAAEAGGSVTITGTTTGTQAGDTVTLVINGNTYTGTVDGSGNFSISVPGSDLAADTNSSIDASISTTDAAGNTGTGTGTKAYTVNTNAPTPSITIDDVTLDNVLNVAEAGGSVNITGTTTGTQAGDTVTLVINGNTYTGTVDGLGNFSISVAGSDLVADSDLTIAASVSTTDINGNEGTGVDTHPFTVDTTAPAVPTVVAQTTTDTTPTVTGTVTLGAGETLEVTINGTTYTTANGLTVDSVAGTWSVTLPATAEGTYPVTATVTDAAGNTSSDVTTNELIIDTTAPAIPTVDPQTTNDTTPTVTGTVTLAAGETLAVTINGTTYTTANGLTVDPMAGTWSVTLPTTAEGTYPVTATVTDAAGNTSSDVTTSELVIDTTAPAIPTVVSQTTANTTPTVTGTAVLGVGETLAVTINGTTYTTANGLTLDPVAGTWSVTLPVTPLGTYTVVATTTDAAGNSVTDSTSNELVISPIQANPDFLPLPTNAPASLSLAIAKTNVTANDVMPTNAYMSAVRGTNGYAAQMRGNFVLLVRSNGLTMGPAFFYDLTFTNTNGAVFTSTTLVTYTNDPVPVGINAGTATCLSISNVSGTSYRLVFAGLPSKWYQIEKTHDLTDTNAWFKAGQSYANTNGYFQWTDTNATNSKAFYRSYHIQTP